MHIISGEYTSQDYFQANRIHLNQYKLWIIARVLLALSIPFYVMIVIVAPREVLSWIMLAIPVLFLSLPYTILPLYWRRIFKNLKQAHGIITVTFDEGVIIESSKVHNLEVRWLDHYVVKKQMLLLYTHTSAMIMLPLRFFHDDNEYDRVIAFLQGFPSGKHNNAD